MIYDPNKEIKGSISAVVIDDDHIVAGTTQGVLFRGHINDVVYPRVQVSRQKINTLHVDKLIYVHVPDTDCTQVFSKKLDTLFVIPWTISCICDGWIADHRGLLLHMDTLEPQKQFDTPITSMVITHQGYMILGLESGEVKCFRNFQQIWSMDIAEAEVCRVLLALSPDHTTVAAVGGRWGRGVDYFIVATGHHVATEEDPFGSKYIWMRGITFSHTGNRIFMWDDRSTFQLYTPLCGYDLISSLFYKTNAPRSLFQKLRFKLTT